MRVNDGLPDPAGILAETDWSALEQDYGSSAFPETPARLSGLVSGDPDTVRAALSHLDDTLVNDGVVYSATAPAARYVAALLGDPRSRPAITPEWEAGRYPLRGRLLAWLGAVAYAVGESKEQWIRSMTGSTEPFTRFLEIRGSYPEIFPSVAAYLDDPDPRVRETAVVVAARLLEPAAMASHRAALAPLVRNVLAVSAEQEHRRFAIETLESWGEDVESLRGLAGPPPAEPRWTGPEGPIDEPPF